MSGHNKWSTIKHKKAREDAKRGKIFTKIIREITVAAREGGGDPDANPRLRTAVAAAKSANMPSDNIERAIQRGTGELPGVSYEEIVYEGYGPGGMAVMLETLSDNRNRTTAEIRHLFSRYGGNLGENGCVGWIFTRRGQILVPRHGAPGEEAMMELAIEAGAEDLDLSDDDYFRLVTAADEVHRVQDLLEEQGVDVESAGFDMEPSTTVDLDGREGRSAWKLLDEFDDHDDVQNVWSNADLDESALADG